MRDDIDFDLVDKQVKVLLDGYQWQTENEAIRFSFNLALDSLKDHEIDRCVWTLKKAVETSVDGEGIHDAVNELLIQADLFQEAIEVLRAAIEKDFEDQYFGWWLGYCLCETGELGEAETYFAIQLENKEDGLTASSLFFLAHIRSKQGRNFEAKALAQEAISSQNRLGNQSSGVDHWNLSAYCQYLNLIEEAINAAKSGQLINPLFEDWDARILVLEKLSHQSDDEDETDLEDSSLETETYEEWFKAGSFWHTDIPKDFFGGTLEFLEGRYSYDANWSDQSSYLFNYSLDDEGLEESLARVESLSSHIHLQTTWPIYLETPDISIAMTLNQNYLLAWVGVGLEGLLVGVNIKTWDLYHADDPDARFAVGAVLNWFLDCSLNILNHEMFISIPHKWREVDRPWELDSTTWSTTSAFTQDIENMRRFTDRTPPRAHRVRGHIRTLTERQPTDEARENAPAYIRRNMSPSDTFVRSYTKSGDVGTDKLLVHLSTKSSLADFLATAPLLEH